MSGSDGKGNARDINLSHHRGLVVLCLYADLCELVRSDMSNAFLCVYATVTKYV